MRPLILISVVCLVVGISVLVTYCHGATSMAFALPVAGTALHMDITTTGAPALLGVVLTALGAILLIAAWIAALMPSRRRRGIADPMAPVSPVAPIEDRPRL